MNYTVDYRYINRSGNPDDVRNSLAFRNPETDPDPEKTISDLNLSLIDERKNRNRVTVIRLLERKLKQYLKRRSK